MQGLGVNGPHRLYRHHVSVTCDASVERFRNHTAYRHNELGHMRAGCANSDRAKLETWLRLRPHINHNPGSSLSPLRVHICVEILVRMSVVTATSPGFTRCQVNLRGFTARFDYDSTNARRSSPPTGNVDLAIRV